MQASQPSNETRLPRAVLKKGAAVAARFAARDEPETPPAATPAPPAAPPSAVVVDTPDPNAPTPGAAAADPRENDPLYWKQRFQATAGRLRVREDEHKEAIKALRLENDQLRGQISTLQTSSQPQAGSTIDLNQFFTAKQIEDLGEDDARAIAQAALTAAMQTAKQAIETEVAPLRKQREDDAKEAAKERRRKFDEAIEARVPNWREIDVSQDWLDWLDERDPVTKAIRGEVLDALCRSLDAEPVAAMFEDYLRSKTRAQPPVAPAGNGAAPSGDIPPAVPEAAGTGYPSKAEIKDFYTRSAIKKPGQVGFVTEAERAKFEARLKQPRR